MHAVRWSAAGVAQDLGDLGGGDSTAIAMNAARHGRRHEHDGDGRAARILVHRATVRWSTSARSAARSAPPTPSTRAARSPARARSPVTPRSTPSCGRTARGRTSAPRRSPAGRRRSTTPARSSASAQPTDDAALQTGFLRAPGLTVIGSGSSFTSANAINAGGQIVGVTRAPTDITVQHAFSRTAAGVVTDIGTLGGTFGAAYAVNTNGAVVGTSTIAGDAETHAFYWTAAGGLLDLEHARRHRQLRRRPQRQRRRDRPEQHRERRHARHGLAARGRGRHDAAGDLLDRDRPARRGRLVHGRRDRDLVGADAESAITTAACPVSTVTADTAGTTFTCTATSAGGTATQSVTIRRATPVPVVTPTLADSRYDPGRARHARRHAGRRSPGRHEDALDPRLDEPLAEAQGRPPARARHADRARPAPPRRARSSSRRRSARGSGRSSGTSAPPASSSAPARRRPSRSCSRPAARPCSSASATCG